MRVNGLDSNVAQTGYQGGALDAYNQLSGVFAGQVLEVGSRGDAAKTVQKALTFYAVVTGRLDAWAGADGVYGNGTAKAVKAFQRYNGLPETGRVDSTTIRELSADIAWLQENGLAGAPHMMPVATGEMVLKAGANRKSVQNYHLQQMLSHFYTQGLSRVDPGGIDGVIGGGTTRAIESFQRGAGLPATGVVDAATIGAMHAAIIQHGF